MAVQRKKNWGIQVLLCAGVLAWQIYDLSTTTEAAPQVLMLLQYLVLALAALGLVGGVVMWARVNRGTAAALTACRHAARPRW
jgi:hypothetical protein